MWSIDKHANVVLGRVVHGQQTSLDSCAHHFHPSSPLFLVVASSPIPSSNLLWCCILGKCVQAQLSDIEALVERVREARLRDIVKQGIGYLHEGMHPGDQDIIHTLFQSGAIQVCALLPYCDSVFANSWSDIRSHTSPALPRYIYGFLVGGKVAIPPGSAWCCAPTTRLLLLEHQHHDCCAVPF